MVKLNFKTTINEIEYEALVFRFLITEKGEYARKGENLKIIYNRSGRNTINSTTLTLHRYR